MAKFAFFAALALTLSRTALDNDRINEFKDRAARRLKPIFEKDLNERSAELIDRLERLRQVEKQLLKAARKESSEPETIGNPEARGIT